MSTYTLLAKYYEHIMDDLLYAIYLERITHYTCSTKMLDIGCGTGYLSRELAAQGYLVDAFDTSVEILEIANHYAVMDGVNLNLFNHNMLEPYNNFYDIIIASVDVINHVKNQGEMQAVIDNIFNHLNKEGFLFIDFLNCDYIAFMDGYEETIMLEDNNIHWRTTKGNKPCSIQHHITINNETSSHQEISFDSKTIKAMLKAFCVLETIVLEERTIYILKK